MKLSTKRCGGNVMSLINKCARCGNRFHDNDLERCPECDELLCPQCFKIHWDEDRPDGEGL